MSDLLSEVNEQIERDYDRLRMDAGRLDLHPLTLLSLEGDDRKGWLQGQVTNDVRGLEPGNSRSFCLCTATGQIQAVVDAWAVPDRILMTTAEETAQAVLQRAEDMVILEDVVGQPMGERYRLISVQGPAASRRLGEILDLPKLDSGISKLEGGEVYCLRSDRTGLGGWDVWVPVESPKAAAILESLFEPISPAAYAVARLEAGIPFFGCDFDGKTFPPELGPAFEAKHVSYKKGCYLGQEVLMRIHSRGHTNRTWVGLLAEGPLEIGATISHPARADAGTVTSIGTSPDYGFIGAAMLRREAAVEGSPVRVITERGEVLAEVASMPILRIE